jgi:hypothetical protein
VVIQNLMMTLFVRGRRVNDVVNCNRAISLFVAQLRASIRR